ncbi:MAG: hypothetical protein NVS2B6_13760 [Thermoleophilaceae bacterium]
MVTPPTHRAARELAAGLAIAVVTSLSSAPQGATASPTDGHPYRHGVVPGHSVSDLRGGAPLPFSLGNSSSDTRSRHHRQAAGQALSNPNNLNYGGGVGGIGVTTGLPEVYVVFWGSQWGTQSTDAQGYVALSGDPGGFAPRLQAFLKGLGSNNELWSGVMTQYCEGIASGSQTCPAGSAYVGVPPATGVLAGVFVDDSSPSPSAASGHDLAAEALRAVAHFGKSAGTSRNAQYVVVSPPGANPDNYKDPISGFCAWHDHTADSTLSGGGAATTVANAVAFTNLPYLTDRGGTCGASFVNSGPAGALDGVTIVEGHEYAETITDQFPSGGWTDATGNENGDKCIWKSPGTAGGSFNLALATGTFAVQTTWSNDAGACQGSHPIARPPAAPAAVTATPGDGTVALSWAAASGATGYRVYRGTSPGGEGATAIAAPSGNSFTDTGRAGGTTYYYTVSATNAYGESPRSSEVHATPTTAPPSGTGTGGPPPAPPPPPPASVGGTGAAPGSPATDAIVSAPPPSIAALPAAGHPLDPGAQRSRPHRARRHARSKHRHRRSRPHQRRAKRQPPRARTRVLAR